MMTTRADEDVLNLERRRCDAINSGDLAALRAVLSDDYLHVHTNGRIDDLESYLDVVRQYPRHTQRGAINVRQYGNVAVLVGDQVNTLDAREMCVVVQQVAVRTGGDWRFVATHVTNKVTSAG